MVFPVAPEVLHRVEFRSVSGQALQFEPGLLAGDPVLDQAAAVSGQAVPDDQQPAREMGQEVSKKLDHLGTANGFRKEPEVETPPGYPGHRREQLPVEMIAAPGSVRAAISWPISQAGCWSSGTACPRTAAAWSSTGSPASSPGSNWSACPLTRRNSTRWSTSGATGNTMNYPISVPRILPS